MPLGDKIWVLTMYENKWINGWNMHMTIIFSQSKTDNIDLGFSMIRLWEHNRGNGGQCLSYIGWNCLSTKADATLWKFHN